MVAVLAELWPPAKAAFLWLWGHVSWFFGLFAADYSTPGWLLALLGVVTLATAIRIVAALIRGGAESTPAHLAYTADYFHGAKWRWGWNGHGIAHIWCFCPSCDSELVYDDSSCNDILRRSEPRTDFICEHCGHRHVARVPGGPKSYALSAIEREIRRKLRTGEVPSGSTAEA
jgi:hypothetical protein